MIEHINSQQKHIEQEEEGIDPIKSALTGDIFPLVASLDYFDFDTLVDTFSPLSHYICTLYIPLQTLLNGRELPMTMNIQNRLPLSFAIKAKDAMATYYCLTKSHQLNTRSVYNITPAMQALKSGFRIGFLLCFHFGHVTNDLANTAAQINDIWALKFLKSMKVPLNQKDLKQITPIENAVANYSYECIDYLAKSYPKEIKMDKFGKIAKSKTIFNNLKEIKSGSNESSSLLNQSILKQIFLLIAIFLSVNTFFNLSNVLYFNIVLLVQFATTILYYNGPTIPKKSQKNILKLIQPFLKSQLPQICPICVQIKRPNYDHCLKCGICIQGFHFHTSVCISKCNQVRWTVKQSIWLIVFYIITSSYVSSIDLYLTSSWKRIQSFTYLYNNSSYLKNDFLLYSVCFFLLFKQLFSCFVIIYVILSGRTYQQVMNSQKYSSLYKPVQIAGQFYNRYSKNQNSTFKSRARNGLSNLVKFIFG